jgi:hypothetical protein
MTTPITPIAEEVVPVPTRAERIENAKQFLKENPTESIACAARIYDLTEFTSSANPETAGENDFRGRCFWYHFAAAAVKFLNCQRISCAAVEDFFIHEIF